MKKVFLAFTLLLVSFKGLTLEAQEIGSSVSLAAQASTYATENLSSASTRSFPSLAPQWILNFIERRASSSSFLVLGQLRLSQNNGCSPNQVSAFNTQFSVNIDFLRRVAVRFSNGLTATGKVSANGKTFVALAKYSVYNPETSHDEDRAIHITAGAISSKGYAPFRFVFGARDTVNNLTCSVQYNGTLKVRKR